MVEVYYRSKASQAFVEELMQGRCSIRHTQPRAREAVPELSDRTARGATPWLRIGQNCLEDDERTTERRLVTHIRPPIHYSMLAAVAPALLRQVESVDDSDRPVFVDLGRVASLVAVCRPTQVSKAIQRATIVRAMGAIAHGGALWVLRVPQLDEQTLGSDWYGDQRRLVRLLGDLSQCSAQAEVRGFAFFCRWVDPVEGRAVVNPQRLVDVDVARRDRRRKRADQLTQ